MITFMITKARAGMAVTSEARASDSPYIESIWHVQAESDGCDIVVADISWDMIITHQEGKSSLCVWGPKTNASQIPHRQGAEAIGIRFKLGTYLTDLPVHSLLDNGTPLPEARCNGFQLNASTWELPTYENVEVFINRLVRRNLLGRDATVEAALQGHEQYMSLRSVQRRILRVTGLTQRYIRSIERAHQAAALLESGTSILDAVYEVGYADQQSMTKALRRFLGQTPGQLARVGAAE
jgi:AraC-like DNA-binding protein